MAPYFTPQRGDIPAKRWRIHPRAKPVAFCCRGKRIKMRRVIAETQRRIRQDVKFTKGTFQDSP